MLKTKSRILTFALIFLLGGCSSQDESLIHHDFETLMGSHLPTWNYRIQTPDDLENMQFFKTIYEKNIPFLHRKSTMFHVPKIIHFIWLGPRPFPRESLENIRSWIAKHPDWIIKFWTDREIPLRHKQIKMANIQDLHFIKLLECYKKSDNYAEKSDILRYEILYQEGGIYADHDVKCFQSFEPLCKAFDFYCGVEMPFAPSFQASILPANSILGVRPGHPILKKAMEWLTEEWDRIELQFPGKDRDSIINRVTHRTLFALELAFKQFANQESNRDIALPAFYFNAPTDDLSIFSRHLYKGTWFENESEFEKLTHQKIKKISKKADQVLLAFGFFSLIHISGMTLLWIKYHQHIRMRRERA
ncbi:MAG: glycosyltransferase [Candidatus Rhabdochlamydia sp.]